MVQFLFVITLSGRCRQGEGLWETHCEAIKLIYVYGAKASDVAKKSGNKNRGHEM